MSAQYALTRRELDQLLHGIPHLRDACILRLAVATGIRRRDLASIRLEGVDLHNGWINFYEHKKRRPWRAAVAGEAYTTLQQWVNTLPRGTKYLFPSNRSHTGHVSSRHLYDVLAKELARAGLPPRPFHALRATFVKQAFAQGWTMEEVMKQTGDTAETLQNHYAIPSDGEMLETARAKAIL